MQEIGQNLGRTAPIGYRVLTELFPILIQGCPPKKRKHMFYLKASLVIGVVLFVSSALAGQHLITFSAMGDTPYSVSEARKLKHQLANLNPHSSFVVHLGDIKTGITPCSERWYQQVALILGQSPIRLFIIPGDNEWNDCADPDQAWNLWTRYFLHFDSKWSNPLQVVRDNRHPENFAFLSEGVLFVGINLVGGRVLDPNLWAQRDQENIQWIEAQLNNNNQPITHLVLFGHALSFRRHGPFFTMFNRIAQSFKKPVLFLHGDGHIWKKDYPFEAKNILRVEVEQGGRANPLTVTITNDLHKPFLFKR